jgi:Cu+-exporting ATPase
VSLVVVATDCDQEGHMAMTKVKDPVCGMEIDKASAGPRITYLGQTYYFCSEECRKTFKATPQEVIKHAPTSNASALPKSGT